MFPKGVSGNPAGRPRGALDKTTRNVKQAIEECFVRLGGIDSLVQWAQASEQNTRDFYLVLLPKLLPAQIKLDSSVQMDFSTILNAARRRVGEGVTIDQD